MSDNKEALKAMLQHIINDKVDVIKGQTIATKNSLITTNSIETRIYLYKEDEGNNTTISKYVLTLIINVIGLIFSHILIYPLLIQFINALNRILISCLFIKLLKYFNICFR